jgi:V-type H+-transporting ATPase subunit H
MSIDPPAYIVSLQNNIRARPISWEGAVRAKTITDEDLKKIKAIDKVRKEQRKQTIEGDVKTYSALLLGSGETKSIFESAAKRTDILQYMLVLTGDLVDGMLNCKMLLHTDPMLTTVRHTLVDRGTLQPPKPIQATAAFAKAVLEPGRPHPTLDVLGTVLITLACSNSTAKVYSRDR